MERRSLALRFSVYRQVVLTVAIYGLAKPAAEAFETANQRADGALNCHELNVDISGQIFATLYQGRDSLAHLRHRRGKGVDFMMQGHRSSLLGIGSNLVHRALVALGGDNREPSPQQDFGAV